ncbi:hypothetical protein [Pantoea ananatis]|uniref:hypothetical protein n=1 Tax=Pantoea ananas TaxID=553 RepID=UPI0023507211|nr:hypothetical protein [Pantoea ananatis]MDC7861189.1 hypothetical protein [Pantoea ananatis]
MKRKAIGLTAILLLLGWVEGAGAISYPYPVISSVKFIQFDPRGTPMYLAQAKALYVSDDRITEDTTAVEALTILAGRRPEEKAVQGEMKMVHPNDVKGANYWPDYELKKKKQKFLDFMEEWTQVVVSNAGNGYAWHSASEAAFCVTARVQIEEGGSDMEPSSYYNRTWGLDSFETCSKPQPTTGYCQLKTATVNFDYGLISSGEADGAALEKPVTVNCTTKIKYNLQVLGGSEFALDNGMAATIMTDGELAGETLNGASGDNTVTLRSVLRGKPAKTGAFAGSGIMVVSYP